MNKTTSIAILSGKGGVGKSNLALNLSSTLNHGQQNVLLMDCDIGLANLDVLLGMTPEYNIQDIILGEKTSEEVCLNIQKTENTNLDLLPGHSGLANFIDLDFAMRKSLTDSINQIAKKYAFLTIDLGAGISPTILAFGAMSDIRLIIVTPEPTAITDSYALIKVMSIQYKIKDFHILVNQVETPSEGRHTFQRLSAACERFLNITPHYLGEIRYDENVTKSVRLQKLFTNVNPMSPASVDCKQLSTKLLRIAQTLTKQNNLALKELFVDK